MKLADRMQHLGTETAFEVLSKAKKFEAKGMDIIHLEIGEPDFDTPSNIIDAGVRAMNEGYTHYGPSPGFTELRERIAQEISETREISVTGDNVIVTPGAKPIMFFTILALVNEGDEVLYPNPGFPIYESMINFVGGVPLPMKLLSSQGFNLDVDQVRGQITSKTKLMIINSPNNPCGSTIGYEEIKALAELAKEHDLLVLTDDIYRRFLYEGDFYSVTSIPGMKDRTIILDGFSKTYAMTGWRLGYGVMPFELIEPISRLVTNSVSCTAGFSQIAALEALAGPQDKAYEMISKFKKRRDLFVNGLNEIPGINCTMPKGAFYAFPNVEATGMSSSEFADDLLSEAGVACLAGESFGEYGYGCVRYSFANSNENLERALERIYKFVISRS